MRAAGAVFSHRLASPCRILQRFMVLSPFASRGSGEPDSRMGRSTPRFSGPAPSYPRLAPGPGLLRLPLLGFKRLLIECSPARGRAGLFDGPLLTFFRRVIPARVSPIARFFF